MNIKNNIVEKAKIVEEVLRRWIPFSEPKAVYPLIWDFLERGGKRVRPYLILTCAEAVGTPVDGSADVAAAVELFHNFTLVHDDIEDGSELRRGKPCLHRIYGLPLALNAGDAMFVYVLRMLAKAPLSLQLKAEVQDVVSRRFIEVVEGQGMELGWYKEGKFDISEEEYLKMVGGKTAALISACCEVGAILGGGSEEQRKELAQFGYEIGLAFQIQDDVLNIIGEEEKYKKEIGGDIREGKRTLMVIHVFKHGTEEQKKRLREILAKEENTEEEIQEAIEIFKETGAVDYAKAFAEELVKKAKDRLRVIEKEDKRLELEMLADLFVKREQ